MVRITLELIRAWWIQNYRLLNYWITAIMNIGSCDLIVCIQFAHKFRRQQYRAYCCAMRWSKRPLTVDRLGYACNPYLRERFYLILHRLYIYVPFSRLNISKKGCESHKILYEKIQDWKWYLRIVSLFQSLLNGTRFCFYFLRGCHIATGRRKAVNICLQWASAFPVEVDPTMMCPTEYAFEFVPWSPLNSATVNLNCIVWKKIIVIDKDILVEKKVYDQINLGSIDFSREL